MTRRGTLAYYVAAWVVGCFIGSWLDFLTDRSLFWFGGQTVSNFLAGYFFSLVFCAFDVLLFAFLLRRTMWTIKTHAPWVWFLSGAALALLLVIALTHTHNTLPPFFHGVFGSIVFGAADVLSTRDYLWQAPIDGAITAVVLCLVDRAFARPSEAGEPEQSPA
jgi:hypothetical protein